MSISKTEAEAFYEKLNTHPKLKARIESLFEMVENSNGDWTTAAEAEQRVREELRQMGNELLRNWASQPVNKTQPPLPKEGEDKFVASGKKNSVGTPLLET